MKYKTHGGKKFKWCGRKVGEFAEVYHCPNNDGACCEYHNNLLKCAMNEGGRRR